MTYRVDNAFAGLVNLTISKHMLLGYAYEVGTGKVLASTKNSNKLFMRFKF
ncbi:type IX secretion system membrane protein PorP/SprF [Flavobacterium sp. PS2]|uniref:type IX secretion system membrane protein PorP/SprF n=1 Tax=Flavobacterium sp. PS2 TaxID=3384157 RepID=UPI00390CAFE9